MLVGRLYFILCTARNPWTYVKAGKYTERRGFEKRHNRKSGAFELYTLEDKTIVNEWRKEVGLPPLKGF